MSSPTGEFRHTGQPDLAERTSLMARASTGRTSSTVLLVQFRVNLTWLVLGGVALGWVMHAARGG